MARCNAFTIGPSRRRTRPLGRQLALAGSLAVLAGSAAAQGAIAPELREALSGPVAVMSDVSSQPKLQSNNQPGSSSLTPSALAAYWVRDIDGQRLIQAIVYAKRQPGSGLAALRQAVLNAGGSVRYEYPALSALSIVVPASAVVPLASRPDVTSISPNRVATRTSVVALPTPPDATLAGTIDTKPDVSQGSSPLQLAAGFASGGKSRPTGAGVTIAVLDSGVMALHAGLLARDGTTRVKAAVDLAMPRQDPWKTGLDTSEQTRLNCLRPNVRSGFADPHGHGTHVASMAAGSGLKVKAGVNPAGIAPEATIFDVRVLGAGGIGQIDDVLAGIDCVIRRAPELGVRVMNLSVASDSRESYLTDPLCQAARVATAAGITVVAAAGNFGRARDPLTGKELEVYGRIGSPGIEPSVITVGSVKWGGTPNRRDDRVNHFSSRGPTRGLVGFTPQGKAVRDNLLKPDLVAPGNRVVGAAAARHDGSKSRLTQDYPELEVSTSPRYINDRLMQLSGTSVAAPVVAGAAALLLEVNPGLTPPLVKAMLQYTAEPLAGYNLLQQGTGMINIDGALSLARAVRTDLSTLVAAGAVAPGATILRDGSGSAKALEHPPGSREWSRMAFAGGNQVVSGAALFARMQPIWDPRLNWGPHATLRTQVKYGPAPGTASVASVKLPVPTGPVYTIQPVAPAKPTQPTAATWTTKSANGVSSSQTTLAS
ncbi:MAG: hypothetical protein RI988_616, partial [Pseudomonadota bacterium]